MSTATTAVDHGITITQDAEDDARQFLAVCLCGWKSPAVGSRPAAVCCGVAHADSTETCSCGKPIGHLYANADSPEWTCRVPLSAPPTALLSHPRRTTETIRPVRFGTPAMDRRTTRMHDNQNGSVGTIDALDPYPGEPPAGSDSDTMMDFLLARDAWFSRHEPERTACPPWCEQAGRENHGYDMHLDDMTVWSRFHETTVGDDSCWAVSREETVHDGRVLALGPVQISYHGDDLCVDVDGARALMGNVQSAIAKALEIDQ